MARSRIKKLDRDELWNYALRALGQKARSMAEIRQKLAARAASAADVSAIVAKLREYGLADDRKFSESFAASRLENRGFGKFRVLRDLRSKRVSSTLATSAVEKAFANTDEAELIEQFLARRFRGKNLAEFLKEEKNVAAAYRKLRTAGFSSARSLEALKRYRRSEDWDAVPEEEE